MTRALARALLVLTLLFVYLQLMTRAFTPVSVWGTPDLLASACQDVGIEFVDPHYLKLRARGGHPGVNRLLNCEGVIVRVPE